MEKSTLTCKYDGQPVPPGKAAQNAHVTEAIGMTTYLYSKVLMFAKKIVIDPNCAIYGQSEQNISTTYACDMCGNLGTLVGRVISKKTE
jgi:hypothetical protein